NVPVNPYTFSVASDLDGDGTREAAAALAKSDGLTHHYLVQLTGDRIAHSVVDLTGTAFEASSLFDFDVDASGRSAMIQTPVTSAEDQYLPPKVCKLNRGQVASNASTPAQTFANTFQSDPPRICRRLQLLRGWSNGKLEVFCGSERASSADGARAPGRTRLG